MKDIRINMINKTTGEFRQTLSDGKTVEQLVSKVKRRFKKMVEETTSNIYFELENYEEFKHGEPTFETFEDIKSLIAYIKTFG